MVTNRGMSDSQQPLVTCAYNLAHAAPACHCVMVWLVMPVRYQSVVSSHPTNVEALRYLVALCQELGRPQEVQKYSDMLRRAERAEVCSWQMFHDPLFHG